MAVVYDDDIPAYTILGVSVLLIFVFAGIIMYMGQENWRSATTSILNNMIGGLIVGIMLTVIPMTYLRIKKKD